MNLTSHVTILNEAGYQQGRQIHITASLSQWHLQKKKCVHLKFLRLSQGGACFSVNAIVPAADTALTR